MTEREIQRAGVKELRGLQFDVMVTSNNRRTANTRGTPDTFVHIGRGIWLAIEWKQPKGKVSEEQLRLAHEGKAIICTSVEDAVKVCIKGRIGLDRQEERR